MGYRSNLQAVRAYPQLMANWLTDMHLLNPDGKKIPGKTTRDVLIKVF
jgi:hypothetical protein